MRWSAGPGCRALIEALMAAWDQWEADRPPAERALTRVAFQALVEGRAPTMTALAPIGEMSPNTLTRTLKSMVAQGLATVEGDRIIGIGGLSLVLAPHALQ